MLIHSIYKSAAWLAFGLGLVACASAANPVDEAGSQSGVPTVSPTSSTVETEQVPPTQSAPTQPAPTSSPVVTLPDLGPAPDINNEVWLNTEQPLNLAALRGKVVLVEFWTFG